MPFWCPARRSRPSSKQRKDGPALAASACCSARHSVDAVVPPTAYASASASPSPQWERAWARSLGSPSPAPRRSADKAPAAAASTSPSSGGSSGRLGRAGAGRGLPLPRPAVYKSAPQLLTPPPCHAEAAPRAGSPASSGNSSESDEAADNGNHSRYADSTIYPGARTMPPDERKCMMEEKHLVSRSAPRERHKFFEVPVTNVRVVHLKSLEASTSGASSRGRSFYKDTHCARTRSLSPSKDAFASSYASPGHLSPRSTVKRMNDLKSLSQPLPCPPAPSTSCPIPSSLTASTQSQSQWKKGKLLGSGTFGQVYLGFNSESGKFCAIKEVQVISDDSNSKERLRQLNQEVDILRQLSHQNIVQYYGSELTDEALSIYIEYVSGGSIYKLLKDYGPFKEPVIRNYTRQILSGLAYLHGRKTVHRDIKGANILVGPNGEVKLADFGVAKHVEDDQIFSALHSLYQGLPIMFPITSYAEIHSFRGSPYWMAPEAIMNKNGYSLEVDIWSLGCTVIEMGTGRHPWHPHKDVPAMFRIINTKDIPEIPESFSKEGKDFLSLCLKRDPAQRPSATQLLGHPFVQDHQARLYLSSKRNIVSLRTTGGLRARGFTGFSSVYPSPNKTHSSHIDLRANMSLPVSPCSSPLQRVKQSNWSCVASPSHPAFSSESATYNPVSYMQNQMRGGDPVPGPWHDISQRPQSPCGSPKRF